MKKRENWERAVKTSESPGWHELMKFALTRSKTEISGGEGSLSHIFVYLNLIMLYILIQASLRLLTLKRRSSAMRKNFPTDSAGIRLLILFAFAFLTNQFVLSQPVTHSPAPFTQFQVSIGTSQTDVAHSIIQTTDGGYTIAGYTWAGGFYAYIAKLDATETLQWTKTFGGTGWDDISSIIQTADGGYIAAGSSIFKIDKNGTLHWCENISGYGNSIIQTTEGMYVIAGYTQSFGEGYDDMFIVKIDSSGSLQWARTVGGTGEDLACSIVQTSDGGYAVTGIGISGIGLITVLKLNSSGNLQWARNFEGEITSTIIQSTDGGYVVIGRTPPPYNLYVIKLNPAGDLQWTRTIGLKDINIANSIIQTADGGYAVVGSTSGVETFPDWYIVKLDSVGILEWSKVVTGGTEIGNEAYSIIHTLDWGYAIAGVKDSFDPAGNMYIVKYDSAWHTCGGNDSMVISHTGTLDSIISITPNVTSPTGFITTRTPTVGSGGAATMICVTGIQPISNKIPVTYKLYQNYPNPFNPVTKIKFDVPAVGVQYTEPLRLVIYNVLGREIALLVNQQLAPGTYEVDWDGTNYPSGIYFYKLTAGDYTETKKMVLMK